MHKLDCNTTDTIIQGLNLSSSMKWMKTMVILLNVNALGNEVGCRILYKLKNQVKDWLHCRFRKQIAFIVAEGRAAWSALKNKDINHLLEPKTNFNSWLGGACNWETMHAVTTLVLEPSQKTDNDVPSTWHHLQNPLVYLFHETRKSLNWLCKSGKADVHPQTTCPLATSHGCSKTSIDHTEKAWSTNHLCVQSCT